MPTSAMSRIEEPPLEALLGDELAAADRALAGLPAILRHLIGHDDHALVSDRIVAQVRAQLDDLARQLTVTPGAAGAAGDDGETLAAALAAHPLVVAHVHALALEARLADQLADRLALDPVVSPLLQTLVASPDPATATTAMNLLAAQARFGQAQRRGELPLAELPGDVLHAVLMTMRTWADGGDRARDARAAEVERAARAGCDEPGSRLGLLQRLVAGMGAGAVAALDVAHAGAALFVTALAIAAGQDREMAILATTAGQLPRLALALRASGLEPAQVEQQVLALHLAAALPAGLATLRPERAAALLAGGALAAR